MAAPATCPDALRARIRRCCVARQLPLRRQLQTEEDGLRVIGMDIHRVFAEVVALLDGKLTRLGRVDMRRDRLEAFARSTPTHDDHVVVEATGNAAGVAEVIGPHVGRVVIANPKQVRLIAEAKIKTDSIDAGVLAKLYASGFLPEVWIPDITTQAMRRQVTRRRQLVHQRTRLKNIVQSVLHAHLVPPCPHRPKSLVAYLGLNPSVHQSGNGPARHGRITKQGSGHTRGMLVEAAWAAARSPGPLRAFFLRVSARRGQHIAAVATARKLVVVVWHMLRREEDYIWVRPTLHARKLRNLELRAGQKPRRGQRGAAHAYNCAEVRSEQTRRAENAELAYRRLTEGWQAKGPKQARTSAAQEERL